MRNRYFIVAALVVGLVGGVFILEATVGKMVYRTKHGAVTYDHVSHTKYAKYNCLLCHTKVFKVFPPFTRGPLHYQPILHRASEAAETSCGMCHRPGGEAFPSAGNCAKCHVKPVVVPYYPEPKA